MDKKLTAKAECLARWPSLRLTCRVHRGRYRIMSSEIFIASGLSAAAAWAKALIDLSRESEAMLIEQSRKGWRKTLEQFGRGIQSASEGARP